MASAVKDMLRAVSAGLQIPTIIILLCLVALTVVLLGSLVVEYFTERKQLSGSIPERQVQKLIRQYDEEESQLESRISELESKQEEAAPRKADINRFIALVRKYQKICFLYFLIIWAVFTFVNTVKSNSTVFLLYHIF